jgi:bifunctional DNA-binding transcriptional regulator/antitoxin component of YhaV-PrlF toxin-antitoxin module
MERIPRPWAVFSKVAATGRTTILREIRKQLKLKPGDTLRYRLMSDCILLDRMIGGSAFAAFSEWASEADEKAYADL